jgi:hypothetical protein
MFMGIRHLALVGALAVAAPAVTFAAVPQWGQGPRGPQAAYSPAYNEGYQRGARAGDEDARRGDRFSFGDEADYRRADAGYRFTYGNRDAYRDQFRRGFEVGYRAGFERSSYNRGGYGDGSYGSGYGRPGGAPWTTGRAVGRNDPASQMGLGDGYEAGLNDARARRIYDPIGEGRYRSADHGYDRRYGSKDLYKNIYRDAFKQGYSRGYEDGRRR